MNMQLIETVYNTLLILIYRERAIKHYD